MNTKELFEKIIVEAANGRVNCYFNFNVLFETMIDNKKVTENTLKYEHCIVPVLEISNFEQFISALDEYLNYAYTFYQSDTYIKDIKEEVNKKKALLTILWSNATYDDFANPIGYIKKRIDFFKNRPLIENNNAFSTILGCNIEAICNKELVTNETPYNITFRLFNENNEEMFLPTIRIGLSNNKAYIYSIQNKNELEKNSFTSKTKRKLYLINDGFNNETGEEYFGVGELKDTTMSFILSANLTLGILNNLDIKQVEFISFMPPRWNAHEITPYYKSLLMEKHNEDKITIDEYKETEHTKNILIQNNITQKFLRTALRLNEVHSGIEINKMPLDGDFNLGIRLSEIDECSNELLNETYNIFKTVEKLR